MVIRNSDYVKFYLNPTFFQVKYMKLIDENTKFNKNYKACTNHVTRMTEGMRKRGDVFIWTR